MCYGIANVKKTCENVLLAAFLVVLISCIQVI